MTDTTIAAAVIDHMDVDVALSADASPVGQETLERTYSFSTECSFAGKKSGGDLPPVEWFAHLLPRLWEELDTPEEEKKFFVGVLSRPATVDDVMKRMMLREIKRLNAVRDAALDLLVHIDVREALVNELHSYAAEYDHRKKYYRGYLAEYHVSTELGRIRDASLECVERMNVWKNTHGKGDHFVFKGESYMKKMQQDLLFLYDSPLAQYISIDLENNVLLAPRLREIPEEIGATEFRERNFIARMSAPQHTMPIPRVAGSLRGSTLVDQQAGCERHRIQNLYFAQQTTGAKRIAGIAKDAPPSAEPPAERRMVYKSPLDRFCTVNPDRDARNRIRRRHPKKATLGGVMFSVENAASMESGPTSPTGPGRKPSFALHRKDSRVMMIHGTGKYWWAVVYHICKMHTIKNVLVKRVRRRFAATKIQAKFKMWRQKNRYAVEVRKHTAARAVQRVVRGHIVRMAVKMYRKQMDRASIIQRAFRCYFARCHLEVLRLYRRSANKIGITYWKFCRRRLWKHELARRIASRKIQHWLPEARSMIRQRMIARVVRGCCLMQREIARRASAIEFQSRLLLLKSTIVIQSLWRSRVATRRVQLQRRVVLFQSSCRTLQSCRRMVWGRERERATLVLQRLFRCWRARLLHQHKRQAQFAAMRVANRIAEHAIYSKAVTRISNAYKRLVARRNFPQLKFQRQCEVGYNMYQERLLWVRCIQRSWRSYRRRSAIVRQKHVRSFMVLLRAASLFVAVAHRVLRNRAASKIGRCAIVYLCRNRTAQMREAVQANHVEDSCEIERTSAAVVLQAWWRQCLSVKLVAPYATSVTETRMLEDEFILRSDAATSIQIAFRRYKAREIYEELRYIRRLRMTKKIQAVWRGWLARRRFVDMCLNNHRRRVLAALRVQTMWRFYSSRRSEETTSSGTLL